MFRRITTHFTVIAVVAQALLGCCRHQAHGADCRHEVSDAPETVAVSQLSCPCTRHRELASQSASPALGSDRSQEPPPRPLSPCTHSRSAYLSFDDAKLRDALSSDVATVAIGIQTPVTQPVLSTIAANGNRPLGAGDPLARSLTQVWRL